MHEASHWAIRLQYRLQTYPPGRHWSTAEPRFKHTVFLVQEHLVQLHKKLEFAERSELARDSVALRDVGPELDRLRIKALIKAREFLITRHAGCLDMRHACAGA